MELEKVCVEGAVRIAPNVDNNNVLLELGTTLSTVKSGGVERVVSRNKGGRSRRRSPQLEREESHSSSSHPQQHQQHQQQQQIKNSRKMRRYNRKMSKRIRRVTQNAPYNNNEFLMEEHDHLYFLDQDGQEEDSNSDEHHQHNNSGSGGSNSRHPPSSAAILVPPYSSSPEEDEAEFLTRDFCNVYQGVHADRLYSMSKPQLIHEYQMMEERVEFLERKLAALSDPSNPSRHPLDTSSDCGFKSDSDSAPMMLSCSAPSLSSHSASSANTSLNDICHLSMKNDDDQGYYT